MYHSIKSISYQGHKALGKIAVELDSKASPGDASDVYIFDKKSQKIAITSIGFVITRTSVSALRRSLKSVNMSGPGANPRLKPSGAPAPTLVAAATTASGAPAQSSWTPKILEVLHDLTDILYDEMMVL
ncbi:hypothetical protein BCON_0437g00040 [Botryotinia convoluta]|uniref:Uncharacterized protein n=1 Tax=Botryotinia convoluta TaxID=54673 RepID=A0A4Z1H7C7_9HELO|nr:hypothetical protein BCON_0437g00040 [Botryotinia convoluta]